MWVSLCVCVYLPFFYACLSVCLSVLCVPLLCFVQQLAPSVPWLATIVPFLVVILMVYVMDYYMVSGTRSRVLQPQTKAARSAS